MKNAVTYVLLGLIFLITVGARLYMAFTVPHFEPEAYFTLRNVENIRHHGLPLFKDELSYGGRTLIFDPLYYYLLALFHLFMPIELVGKIIPNILASTLVIIAFFIGLEITKNRNAALFTALFSGFIPIFFSNTINSASIYALAIPLTFLALYFFMRITEDPNSVVPFIVVMAFFRYTHPTIILFVMALLFYLLLVYTENIRRIRPEIEVILFVTFVVVWSMFVAFKNAFLVHGPYVIWQNVPDKLLFSYFSNITLFQAIYEIGIIPIICGVYIIYKYMFKEKNKSLYLLLSFVIPIFFLLWFKLIELTVGLMFLGAVLVFLFSQFIKNLFSYIEKTKVAKYGWLFMVIFGILFVFSSFFPSIYYAGYQNKNSVSDPEIRALEWLKDNTNADATVLGTLDEGYLINYIAERRNVADPNFLLIKDINQRFNDIRTIFTASVKTEAIRLMNFYDVDYLYLSDRAKSEFHIQKPEYIGDDSCFELVYAENPYIYKSRCVVEEK